MKNNCVGNIGQIKSSNRDNITILLPCKNQKIEYLIYAINSVLQQTCGDWELIVIVYPETPEKVKKIIHAYCRDKRIKMLVTKASPSSGIAGSLNTGMKHANTEFLAILLSDDCLDKKTVAILKRYIRHYPEIDFFHSSRIFMDSKGILRGRVLCSKKSFTLDYFKKKGSPAKHLLCWRRSKGIDIGGMDTNLGLHGCDDYDFPWRMAEAGCKFKAIKECLYYMRIHHDFFRLTTGVSVNSQIGILRKMFKKHKVPKKETEDYIAWALKNYLIKDRIKGYN